MIQQRGHRWRVVVQAQPDPLTGKRRQLSGSAATRQEAVQLERQLQSQAREVGDGRISIRQLVDEWRESEAPADPSMFAAVCERQERYVLPLLGDKRVEQVRPRLVSRFFEYLNDDGLESVVVREVRRDLSALMSYAVAMEYAESNPVPYVRLPQALDD